MGRESDLVAMRLARGCRCFAVWAGGEVAGYGWLSTRPEWIGELQLEITPGAGEAYIWNCVTLPAYRRKGVFSSLLVGITRWGGASGLRRLWIGSVAIPAEKAVRPAGFRRVLDFRCLDLAGFRRLTISPSPEAAPELVSAGCHVLSVQPGSTLQRASRRRH